VDRSFVPEHPARDRAAEEGEMGENRVEVGRVANGVRRRWLLVVILMLLGAALGFVRYEQSGPAYQARISVLVGPSLRWSSLTQDDVTVSQDLAHLYGDLVERQPVLQATVTQLGLPGTWQQLRNHIRVSFPSDAPQVLQITVTAPTAERAAAMAAEIGKQVTTLAPSGSEREAAARNFAWGQLQTVRADIVRSQAELGRLEANASPGAAPAPGLAAARQALVTQQEMYASLLNVLTNHPPTNRLEILEPSEASSTPVGGNLVLDVGGGALVGLVAGLVIAYIFEFRRRADASRRGVPELPLPPAQAAREDGDLDRRPVSIGTARGDDERERLRRGRGGNAR
jgi:capsular polysaccharide biosynthesis protein